MKAFVELHILFHDIEGEKETGVIVLGYPFLRVTSLSDGNLLMKTFRCNFLVKTFRWKLESLHCQRGLAFLESNATFRLESDSSAGVGRLSKPSFDCNLERERAEDWTQRKLYRGE